MCLNALSQPDGYAVPDAWMSIEESIARLTTMRDKAATLSVDGWAAQRITHLTTANPKFDAAVDIGEALDASALTLALMFLRTAVTHPGEHMHLCGVQGCGNFYRCNGARCAGNTWLCPACELDDNATYLNTGASHAEHSHRVSE